MIPLGYEIGSGRRVSVPLGHLVVTGQTQKSGKTTTLEALITRSQLRAVAFITKRGEKSFRLMTPIPPYFQERADWQFVQALLETSMKTKMDFKQAWIMRAADGANTLQDVRDNIRRFLHGEYEDVVTGTGREKKTKREWSLKPARGLNADMYYVLDQYFEEVMPQVQRLKGSSSLRLARGVNVMDLSEYTFPMQALVIRSVLEYIYEREHGVIVIIPEAWEFIPEGRRSPVRLAAEELIRKGAAEKNYVWLDSQDIAGVAKVLLRQMEVWIFGVQRDPRELKRTLDALPDLPRPRGTDIALLGKGQFIVAFGNELVKCYVQPAGMGEAHAQAIARGEEKPESWTQIVRSLDDEKQSAISDTERDDRAVKPAGHEGLVAERESESSADRASLAGMEGTGNMGDDEMWKEKYEGLIQGLAKELKLTLGGPNPGDSQVGLAVRELVQAHDALAARVRALEQSSTPHARNVEATERRAQLAAPSGGNGSGPCGPECSADLLGQIRAELVRLATEDPEITSKVIQILQAKPELQIKRQIKRLEMDSSSLRGALGILISEKFFDGEREFADVRKELIRRGVLRKKAPNLEVSKALMDLVELGFLTKEELGYAAVAGMKVNIVETTA